MEEDLAGSKVLQVGKYETIYCGHRRSTVLMNSDELYLQSGDQPSQCSSLEQERSQKLQSLTEELLRVDGC